MKKTITLFLIMSSFFINAQNLLETKPSLIGINLGDNYSKWASNLTFYGSRGEYSRYSYKLLERKTIFGYEIKSISMFFNKTSMTLVAVCITTDDLPTTSWDAKNFMPIVENLKGKFGEESGVNPDAKTASMTYYWSSNNNYLYMFYDFKGSLVKGEVSINLSTKKFLDSSEDLK